MGDLLTFTPRRRPVALEPPPAMPPAEKRARLGEALQTALDAADKIIAALERLTERARIGWAGVGGYGSSASAR